MAGPTSGAVAIGPLGVGDVLDAGLGLARRNARALALAVARGVGPAYAGTALLRLGAPPTPARDLLALIAEALGAGLATIAVAVACVRAFESSASPADLAPGALYRAAWRSLHGSIWWAIVLALIAVPIVFLVPLAVYLGVRWSVAWVALVAEGIPLVPALGRSWRLTRRAWWHTLLVNLAATLVVGLPALAVLGAVLLASYPLGLDGPAGTLLTALVNALLLVLLTPPWTAMMVVLYYELRARTEGFDLEQRGRPIPPLD